MPDSTSNDDSVMDDSVMDNPLSDALASKKSTRATGGTRDAEEAVSDAPVPASMDEVGTHAERLDHDTRPRRKQTNVDLPEDLKKRFKAHLSAQGGQMRFVVEDLIRLYLDKMGG